MQKFCECGCGEQFESPNKWGYEALYVHGHQTKTLVARTRWKNHVAIKDRSEIKFCACGCKTEFFRYSIQGKERTYVNNGHRARGTTFVVPKETRLKISATHKKNRETNHLWHGGIPQRGDRCSNAPWKILRDEVYARDNWICQVCHEHCPKGKIICHHIIPVRHGGLDALDNLAVVCRKCHSKQEWLFGTKDYWWVAQVGIMNIKDSPRRVCYAA